MKLICITGIDGAGKTTLARNLVATLKKDGTRVRYLYGRTYPVLSRLLMIMGSFFFLRKHDAWNEYQDYHAYKKMKMRNPFFRIGYSSAIVIDYLLQIWIKLLPYHFSSEIIVLDRYIYDTVISDLTVHLDLTDEQTKSLINKGLKLMPVPMLTVLIDLPAEVAFSRKEDVPHLDYLTERRKWYITLIERQEVIRINGEERPEKILQNIVLQYSNLSMKKGAA